MDAPVFLRFAENAIPTWEKRDALRRQTFQGNLSTDDTDVPQAQCVNMFGCCGQCLFLFTALTER